MALPFDPDPSGPVVRDDSLIDSTGGGGTAGPTGPAGPAGAAGAAGASGPLVVYAAAMTTAATNGAAVATVEMATNKEMVDSYNFDSATSQAVWFPVRFPTAWNAGTVTAHFQWMQAGTGTNGVVFGISAVSVANDETIDVAPGTEVNVSDTALGSTTKLHTTTESAAITIAGTPAVGEMVWFRIQRKTADGSDTLAELAKLLAVIIAYSA